MNATLTLIDLAGAVALLIWGVHMVQTGITRAFGPQLRRILSYALSNRFKGFLAGLGVTSILQSSTATGLMTTAVAAGGLVDLVPALAVMLGANVGTTLIVQLLSFDVSRLVSVNSARRVHVSAQRNYSHARSRSGWNRARSDADRASAPPLNDYPLRGRAEPAGAPRRGHDRPDDRHTARCRIDLGGTFECRRRVADHGLRVPGGRAAARRFCSRPRSQPRHGAKPDARERGRWRSRRQAPADWQSDQPLCRVPDRACAAEVDRSGPGHDRARCRTRRRRFPHRLQRCPGAAVLPSAEAVRSVACASATGARRL